VTRPLQVDAQLPRGRARRCRRRSCSCKSESHAKELLIVPNLSDLSANLTTAAKGVALAARRAPVLGLIGAFALAGCAARHGRDQAQPEDTFVQGTRRPWMSQQAAEDIVAGYIRNRWPQLPLKVTGSSPRGEGWMVAFEDLSYDGPGSENEIRLDANGRVVAVFLGM